MSYKTIFISLASHIVLFSVFSLSFGNKISKADYASAIFLGGLLYNYQVAPFDYRQAGNISNSGDTLLNYKVISKTELSNVSPELLRGKPADEWRKLAKDAIFKPAVFLRTFAENKPAFSEGAVEESRPKPYRDKREPVVVLHPLLPYSFGLYFKDRQVAHVELEFKISSFEQKNSIMVKRKISSGNLEVDLLTMRYMGHYLFIQQAKFSPNNWHTVKVDLSAKSD